LGIGGGGEALTRYAAVAYLFFALGFWLFWIPFSALRLESRRGPRRLLWCAAVLGGAAGVLVYFPVVTRADELLVTVERHSLYYDLSPFPAMSTIPALGWHLGYLVLVCVPFFIVARDRKGLMAFSVALVLSATISHVFFLYAFASVWCFFAAFMSLILGYIFHRMPVATAQAVDPGTAREVDA
jgi:hypothetical protein